MLTRLHLLPLLIAALFIIGKSPTTQEPRQTLAGVWTFNATSLENARVEGLDLSGDTIALAPASGRGELLSPTLAADFEFIALGATWDGDAEPQLEVRVSQDGQQWGPWLPLPVDADHRPEGQPADGSELLIAQGRFAQLRVVFVRGLNGSAPEISGLELHYLDTRAGPTAEEAASVSVQSVPGDPPIIPRSGWGADERLRFRSDGSEIWPRLYRTPKKFFIHHTATSNNISDPAAVVRAVYYYHAVTRGWGDIGYHFLVDHQGRIYEGRYGGEQNLQLPAGGHVYGYNYSSDGMLVGISVLGNFQEIPVPAPVEASVTNLLAARAARYGIAPQGSGYYIDRWFNNIAGHRDAGSQFGSTTCPGNYLYDRLPAIRQTTADKLKPPEPVCSNILINGDMESDEGWAPSPSTDVLPWFTTEQKHGGQRSLVVGVKSRVQSEPQAEVSLSAADYRLWLPLIIRPTSFWSSARQQVQLPADLTSATLELWFKPERASGDDRQYLLILDEKEAVSHVIFAEAADGDWRSIQYDLTNLAGRTIYVYAGVKNDGLGEPARLYVDDATLTVCRRP